MGDSLHTAKISRNATSHTGQLSLAIPQWAGAMSTGGKGKGKGPHT